MQLTLTEKQAQVLADAIKSRLDQLTHSIAKSDTRSFREQLSAEGDVLEDVYRQLGCEHPEWTEAKACAIGREA